MGLGRGTHGGGMSLYAVNQNTVRDVAAYDAGEDETSVVNHLAYNSFGEITSQSDSDFQPLHGYTGRELDPDTGLMYYRHRWYDPATRQFLSQDPIGFAAGDTNLVRYVGNGPTNFIDPSGREGITFGNAYGTVGVYHRGTYVGWVPDPMADTPMVQRLGIQFPLIDVLQAAEWADLEVGKKDWTAWFNKQAKERADAEIKANRGNTLAPAPTTGPTTVRSQQAIWQDSRPGDFLCDSRQVYFEEIQGMLPVRGGIEVSIVVGGHIEKFVVPQTPLELMMAAPGVGGLISQVLAKGGMIFVKYGGKLIAHTVDDVAKYLTKSGVKFASHSADDLARALKHHADDIRCNRMMPDAPEAIARLERRLAFNNKFVHPGGAKLKLSETRVAVFDTKTGKMYYDVSNAGSHLGVLQRHGLPTESGRYAGGFLEATCEGRLRFNPTSGTFPHTDPDLPANILDLIRGTGVSIFGGL